MTLREVIRAIEAVAIAQPGIGMVVRDDIFRLNACPDACYAVFGWTQGQHSGSAANDLMSWRFTFFYIDRLTENGRNEMEVQSTGIEVLRNVLRQLADMGITADSWTFDTFNQRFADECAGVFCSVTLYAPVSWTCPEYFDIDNDKIF